MNIGEEFVDIEDIIVQISRSCIQEISIGKWMAYWQRQNRGN